MFDYMLGALVATAVPTVAPPKPVIIMPSRKPAAAADMTAMFKLFDTFFPPQPAPDPMRLPLAHVTALALLPPGSLGKAVGDTMGGMVERALEMRGSDFPSATKRAGAATPADKHTLRETMVDKDPFFEERMRLTRAAAELEFKRYAAILEPRMRDGIARVVARHFDQRQLTEINAFFATDSGRALGHQFLGLWFDPDLMRSMVGSMPEMVKLMPGSMERIQAATAHLPKPPKPAPPKPPTRVAPKPKPART